jgi:hypothetical protein
MKNGNYILIVAPDDWPGTRYRGKYCYEHQYVYWKNTGINPKGHVIHHKDENPHNNDFSNLEISTHKDHAVLHMTVGRLMVDLMCPMCHRLFTKPRNITHLVLAKSKATYCSRSCSARASHVKVNTDNNVIRVYNELD